MSEPAVCIHAHFYQPPRENPWLDEVEPEPSASPHHDWNERITAECYGPNGAARVVDSEGRIESIWNNYGHISFNFGPTLLVWMQAKAPAAYAAIIEADAATVERFGGHGSALAQPYNHLIMPLATARDRRTQVVWGVADFRLRFGRNPEGMWLPETAVDIDTLEALAENGVRFTILAPHQAGRVRLPGGDWHDVGEEGLDTTVAYRQVLPSGREIALFFYDGPTSRAVAFEKLLHDGETFAERLIELARAEGGTVPRLVHIATDGETYGHHHAHGDMALAVALRRLEWEPGLRLTNYAQYLAENPPVREVEIRENTSWSCAHGIERWRSDCGCSTGGEVGWNQEWRGPLRTALDDLSEDLARVFEEKGAGIFVDPWAARDRYIDAVLGSSSDRARFLDEWCRSRREEERTLALRLLEMQRSAMLMFTSCGWFFNDLAGIETRQVLRYAARALDLAESVGARGPRNAFLDRLSETRGNGEHAPSGREVLLDESRAARVSALDIAADRVARLAASVPPVEYAMWQVADSWATVDAPGARAVAGTARVTDSRTEESLAFRCRGLALGSNDIRVRLRVEGHSPGVDPIADLGLAGLRPDTRLAIENSARGAPEQSVEEESAVREIRAAIAELESLVPGVQRQRVLRTLEGLMARAEAASELPFWELQNGWWRATRRPAWISGNLAESVARRLGFVDRDPD